MTTLCRIVPIGMLAGACCATLAAGQPPAPTPTPAPAPAPADAQSPLDTAPPQARVGIRAEALRQIGVAASAVVIVKDASSYRAAIAAWTPQRRFPVLIDDNTREGREDIARFVRGYKPKQVVRWEAARGDPAPFVPANPADINRALLEAWDIPLPPTQNAESAFTAEQTNTLLTDTFRARGLVAAGMVLTDGNDPAWTGALALAAARGQVIGYTPTLHNINHFLTPAEADRFEKAARDTAIASGLSWSALGDDLDAVTIALNIPARLEKGGGEFLAVSDRIGRLGEGLEAKQRWAWASQVHGGEAKAAYRAMCSFFLDTGKAFCFDGYELKEPFTRYDLTAAAMQWRERGAEAEVFDQPKQGERDWRLRMARPIDATSIFVNTMGNADFFTLQPGQGRAGDIPILTVPAAVHFVHSWSAQFAGARGTIAARWLENGAFLYIGSVNEPFLQAFVPPVMVVRRLYAGCPWAVAARIDDAPMWKIATFGDPLNVYGPALKRDEAPLPLEGVADVTTDLRELLTGGDFVPALQALSLAGRDADAAKLAQALLAGPREKLTAAAAAECVMPLFRAGANASVVEAFRRLDAATAKDNTLRDALWLASYPLLDNPDADLLNVLKANIRPDTLGPDAVTLANAWSKAFGRSSAHEMLTSVRALAPNKDVRDAMERDLRAAKW